MVMLAGRGNLLTTRKHLKLAMLDAEKAGQATAMLRELQQ